MHYREKSFLREILMIASKWLVTNFCAASTLAFGETLSMKYINVHHVHVKPEPCELFF